MILAAGTVLPAWLVIPVAGLVMLVISAHVLAMQKVEMPASRRRIRTANGVVMLLATPMLAYALGVAGPVAPGARDQAREAALLWMTIIALLGLVVMLAGLDILNNIRLFARARRGLNRRAADALAGEVLSKLHAQEARNSSGRNHA